MVRPSVPAGRSLSRPVRLFEGLLGAGSAGVAHGVKIRLAESRGKRRHGRSRIDASKERRRSQGPTRGTGGHHIKEAGAFRRGRATVTGPSVQWLRRPEARDLLSVRVKFRQSSLAKERRGPVVLICAALLMVMSTAPDGGSGTSPSRRRWAGAPGGGHGLALATSSLPAPLSSETLRPPWASETPEGESSRSQDAAELLAIPGLGTGLWRTGQRRPYRCVEPRAVSFCRRGPFGWPGHGHGPLHIPISALERIEVLRGGGSTRYGPQRWAASSTSSPAPRTEPAASSQTHTRQLLNHPTPPAVRFPAGRRRSLALHGLRGHLRLSL